LIFALTSSPFWLFEFKHNFSQVKSVIIASKKDMGQPTGFIKLKKIVNASAIETQQRLIIGWPIKKSVEMIWIVFIFITYIVLKFKKIDKKEFWVIFTWVFIIGLAQFTSKRIVSEYYFTNYLVIFILFLSLFFDILCKNKNLKKIAFGVGGLYLIFNLFWLNRMTNQVNDSYFYKKELVEYIKADQIKNKYPCVGINYVTNFGNGVGFRYLFWYKGVDIIKPSGNVPTYNIIIPWETSAKEINQKFGRLGVVLPTQKEASSEEWCKDIKNQIDPLLGYTE
jgi:hypothetical protein